MVLGGVAVAATGLAVSSAIVARSAGADGAEAGHLSSSVRGPLVGSAGGPGGTGASSVGSHAASLAALDLGDRNRMVSRSDERSVDATKKRALDQQSGGQVTRTEDLTPKDPRTIARAMLPEFGFSADQFSCLDSIYLSESGWNLHAANPSSSAYGIPQALPGAKMASAGPNWQNDATTQIRWGLGYIKSSYGSPCGAWSFWQAHRWY